MATLKDYRDERLRKLDELKALGLNPFPAEAHRTNDTKDVIERFSELENQEVTVAGRVMAIRKFGKLGFIVVRDYTGSIQLFLSTNDVAALDAGKGILGMEQLPLLDTGDFVEATGPVVTVSYTHLTLPTN
jgi:lysyl-tRNA synthetase class 2